MRLSWRTRRVNRMPRFSDSISTAGCCSSFEDQWYLRRRLARVPRTRRRARPYHDGRRYTRRRTHRQERPACSRRNVATVCVRSFAANAVRLQLRALAYNPGNFLRTLATPEPIKDWSLTSLKEKLIKIGAKVVSHGRYIAFQMAEVAIPRRMFQEILRLIAELRPQPPPAPA